MGPFGAHGRISEAKLSSKLPVSSWSLEGAALEGAALVLTQGNNTHQGGVQRRNTVGYRCIVRDGCRVVFSYRSVVKARKVEVS